MPQLDTLFKVRDANLHAQFIQVPVDSKSAHFHV